MAKRRKKRRGNRDRQPPKLPRPSRGQRSTPQQPPSVAGAPGGANRQATSPVDASEIPYSVGDVVSGVVIGVMDDFHLFDVGGAIGAVQSWDLTLTDSESTQDRYFVGHTVPNLLVWRVDRDIGGLALSAQRNKPGYVEALNAHSVGDVVSATVIGFEVNGGLWLDVGGVIGAALPQELPLADGESVQDRYAIGDTVPDIFVCQVNRDARVLDLSTQRNKPGYVETLNAHSVGDVVSATVTAFQGNGGLWLNVGGVVGGVSPRELSRIDGESAQDRYAVGDTVHDLFVWQVNHNTRELALSVRRSMPGYGEALNAYSVGDVISATVTDFQSTGGLWLDVDGVIGAVGPQELSLNNGASTQDLYAVGDTVHELFLWQVSDSRTLSLSVRRNMPGYVEALAAHSVGDIISATVTGFQSDGGLWLDVDGVIGAAIPNELPPDDESALDYYAVGDTVSDLFICQVDLDDRYITLSVRRSMPSYVKKLSTHSVGDIVSATITDFQSNGGLWLDVDGVIGSVLPRELPLANDESAQDCYFVGDTLRDLFIRRVNNDDRYLEISVRRNMPGYVETLNTHSVGDIVSATITASEGRGLWLDVGNVIGGVPPWELPLADDKSAQNHYAVGDTVHDLFVWQVHHADRSLALSVQRNTPGYVEALNAHSVGDIVSATVTGFLSNGGLNSGLLLDVGGVIGSVLPRELSLVDGESVQELYTVGDTVDNLFVWQVDHDYRRLALSVRRNTLSYIEVFTGISVGTSLDGIVIEVHEGGIWLDVAGAIGWIPAQEIQSEEGQPPPTQYSDGDSIRAHAWQIDQASRTIILSARRLSPNFSEKPIKIGATIDVVIRGSTGHGLRSPIRVLAANSEVWIPPHALALTVGALSQFKDGEVIRPTVTEVDGAGRPTRLSLRRALDGWDTAVERLSAPDFLIPNARIVPYDAVTEAELRDGAAAVDLGPILGLISQEETDAAAGKMLMKQSANLEYGVVVESVDRERGTASVSHDRFEARWREVAEQLELKQGGEFEGELRDFDRVTALFDLGSGLLAQMPARELPVSDPPGKAEADRIGERFSLRITSVDHDKQIVHVEPRNQWVEALISEPESETLEFKEVLKGDPGADDAREMTRQAMRTINAFLNAEGGRLIVGVHDETREVTGLEGDPGLDADTIEKKIDLATQILESNLANLEPLDLLRDDLGGLVAWEAPLVRGRTLLVITCKRGPDAGVNLKIKGKPEFWVRDGSSKKQLRTQNEIRDHLRTRQQRSAATGDAVSDG